MAVSPDSMTMTNFLHDLKSQSLITHDDVNNLYIKHFAEFSQDLRFRCQLILKANLELINQLFALNVFNNDLKPVIESIRDDLTAKVSGLSENNMPALDYLAGFVALQPINTIVNITAPSNATVASLLHQLVLLSKIQPEAIPLEVNQGDPLHTRFVEEYRCVDHRDIDSELAGMNATLKPEGSPEVNALNKSLFSIDESSGRPVVIMGNDTVINYALETAQQSIIKLQTKIDLAKQYIERSPVFKSWQDITVSDDKEVLHPQMNNPFECPISYEILSGEQIPYIYNDGHSYSSSKLLGTSPLTRIKLTSCIINIPMIEAEEKFTQLRKQWLQIKTAYPDIKKSISQNKHVSDKSPTPDSPTEVSSTTKETKPEAATTTNASRPPQPLKHLPRKSSSAIIVEQTIKDEQSIREKELRQQIIKEAIAHYSRQLAWGYFLNAKIATGEIPDSPQVRELLLRNQRDIKINRYKNPNVAKCVSRYHVQAILHAMQSTSDDTVKQYTALSNNVIKLEKQLLSGSKPVNLDDITIKLSRARKDKKRIENEYPWIRQWAKLKSMLSHKRLTKLDDSQFTDIARAKANLPIQLTNTPQASKSKPVGKETLPEYAHLYKIALLGDSGVGKSCLLLRFVDDTYTSSFISTIGVDFKYRTVEVNNQVSKLQIWDTAGQERFKLVGHHDRQRTHGIILCFDVTDEASFNNVKVIKQREIDRCYPDIPPVILVGNKIDLQEKRAVSYQQAVTLADELGMAYVETSALENNNVDEAFYQMTAQIMHRHKPLKQKDESVSPAPSIFPPPTPKERRRDRFFRGLRSITDKFSKAGNLSNRPPR